MTDEDLKSKIRALLSKTEENGATRAEALQAVSTAQKLMDRHGLTEEQILEWEKNASREDITSVWQTSKGRFKEPAWIWLGASIMKFSGTFIVVYSRSFKIQIHGREEDVMLCDYLLKTFNRAIHSGFTQWQRETPKEHRSGTRATQFNAFCSGFAEEVREKIRQAQSESSSTGTELVVKKSEIVERAVREGDASIGKSRGGTRRFSDSGAHDAGRAAGRQASVQRPVRDNARSTQRLGG